MIDFIKRWTSSEHERARQDLSAYIDGRLPATSRARLEKHLQGCSECRAELASLQETVDLLHALPTVKLPRSFLLPASQAVAQRQIRRVRLGYSYLQAATAAATALLVLVVSGEALLRYQPAQPPEASGVVETEATAAAPYAEPATGVLSAVPEASVESLSAEGETPALAQQVESVQAAPVSSPQAPEASPLRAGSPSPGSIPPPSGTLGSTQTPEVAKSGFGAGAPANAETATAVSTDLVQTPTASAAEATPATDAAPAASSTPLRLAAVASPQPVSTTGPDRMEPALGTPTWLPSLLMLRPYMRGAQRVLAVLVAALMALTLWLRRRAG